MRKWDTRRIVLLAVSFVSVAAILYSSYHIISYYYESYLSDRQAAELQQIYEPSSSETSSVSASSVTSSQAGLETYGLPALKKMNPDTVGWITLPGTVINYPVLKGTDNAYYLKHDFYKKYNNHGSIFLDYRNVLSPLSKNTVIYGHNMKDGLMFGSLVNFADVNVYKKSPLIILDSGNERSVWVIFSAFYAIADESQGQVFYYNKTAFGSNEEYLNFIKKVRVRSVINTGVEVGQNDLLLTLSTCAYNFDDARFAVVARKLRPGESETVNTSAAVKNTNALYPDIWYSKFGGTKPDEQQLINALS